jgi:hypothetical protein
LQQRPQQQQQQRQQQECSHMGSLYVLIPGGRGMLMVPVPHAAQPARIHAGLSDALALLLLLAFAVGLHTEQMGVPELG